MSGAFIWVTGLIYNPYPLRYLKGQQWY
jgi:hypothetical protein